MAKSTPKAVAPAAKEQVAKAEPKMTDLKKGSALMKFPEDKKVDGKVKYKKDEVYEISAGSIDRWQKRGGIIVKSAEEVVDAKRNSPPPASDLGQTQISHGITSEEIESTRS